MSLAVVEAAAGDAHGGDGDDDDDEALCGGDRRLVGLVAASRRPRRPLNRPVSPLICSLVVDRPKDLPGESQGNPAEPEETRETPRNRRRR